VVRIWRSALKTLICVIMQVGLQEKDSKFPVNADLLFSNVLMPAVLRDTIKNSLYDIMAVNNGLQGIVAVL
jgi:hypothetical protein